MDDETPTLADLRAARDNLHARGDLPATAALQRVISWAEYIEFKVGQRISAEHLRALAEHTARELADAATLHDAEKDTSRAQDARRGAEVLEGYRPSRHEGEA